MSLKACQVLLLLGCSLHSWSGEVPADYLEKELADASVLADYASAGASTKIAFLVRTDVDVSPQSHNKWTSSARLLKSGSFLFKGEEESTRYNICFAQGASAVFYQPLSVTFETLSTLRFNDIHSTVSGGAVILTSDAGLLEICDVINAEESAASVEFRGCSVVASTTGSGGGAIRTTKTGARLSMHHNGNVEFHGNEVQVKGSGSTGMGGAIASAGSMSFHENDGVIFRGNKVTSASNNVQLQGGALYSSGTMEWIANGQVVFEKNEVTHTTSGSGTLSGGAVYANGSGIFRSNAMVQFVGNRAVSDKSSTHAYGGALYTSHTLSFVGNDELYFEKNAASVSSDARGGAIYTSSTLELLNNGDVLFAANHAETTASQTDAYGGALYSTGSLCIAGNQSVVFMGNYEKTTDLTHPYRLRAIYWKPDAANDTLELSAATGGDIVFYDSVYGETSVGGQVDFNADYTDIHGQQQQACGNIIFSGEHVVELLKQLKGENLTEVEVKNSQTSHINNLIALHRGCLQVVDGANLYGRGIRTDSGQAAAVLLRNGSLNHDGYHLVFEAASGLMVQGCNSVTADALELKAESYVKFYVGEEHTNQAALDLNTTLLSIEGPLVVQLYRTDGRGSGHYQLISQKSSSYFVSSDQWTADNVIVEGFDDAAGACFEDLLWQDGSLYYVVNPNIWQGGEEAMRWDTISEHWITNNHLNTYRDGMDIVFSDSGVGEIELVGKLAPGNVNVSNGLDTEYRFYSREEGGGAIVGEASIRKEGAGTLSIATANEYTGETILLEGILRLQHSEALGHTARLETHSGSCLMVENESAVQLEHRAELYGAVIVETGASLSVHAAGYHAESNQIDGTLVLKGEACADAASADSGAMAGVLSGHGQVEIKETQVSFSSLEQFTGDLAVLGEKAALTIKDEMYSAVGTVEIRGQGATLEIRDGDLELLAGGSVIMAGGKLCAEHIIVQSGAEWISDAGGWVESDSITLQAGSTYRINEGCMDLGGAQLILSRGVPDESCIHLILNEGLFDTSDATTVLLFSGVGDVLFGDEMLIRSNAGGSSIRRAADYFDNAWINPQTQMVYDAAAQTLSLHYVSVPEPSVPLLGLWVLAAALQCRRRH